MSKTIDEKVVSMRFDNKDFERNVSTSLSTLDKLKQKLNFKDAKKGFEDINVASKKVDMKSMSNAIETVNAKFSALQVMGITALNRITNAAITTGKRIVSALTIDPIKTGFQEYETKINAIQTIMANTANKGTTMKDITEVIDELNTYADKTIYNFAEMTRNIGTFTAAGVGLRESASAIKGIANLAAASGSSSMQASTAMYQLSQALAAGTVKLQDWNSVVNAGMGGQKFQEALKATAREHGIAVDKIIKKQGSFRESLQEGWITADILNETLSKFTVDGAKKYAKSMMDSGKWTQAQADALIKEAQSMEDAATKVKTFTQLIDTLKESIQSGWGKTWEIVFGDFEEAKSLFTEISNTLGGMIDKSSDARNNLLQGWKDQGGRTALIDSLKNAFEGLLSIIKPINEAFKEIFPPITSKQLVNITNGLKELTSKMKISNETADKLKRTFKGVFSIFDMIGKVLISIGKIIGSMFQSGAAGSILDALLIIPAALGDFFTELNKGFNLDDITDGMSNVFKGISETIKSATKGLDSFGNVLSSAGKKISGVFTGIWNGLKTIFKWLTGNISIGDIINGLVAGSTISAFKKLSGLIDDVRKVLSSFTDKKKSGGGIGDQVSKVLSSVHDSLVAFTTGIKVTSLIAIASSMAILSSAIRKLSGMNVEDLAKSLAAMSAMFVMLSLTFKSMDKTIGLNGSKGIFKSSIALIAIAKSLEVLADAVSKMGKLSLEDVSQGLISVGAGVSILVLGLKKMNGVEIKMSSAVAMVVLAESCKILADAVIKMGKLSLEGVAKGLISIAGGVSALVLGLKVLNKVKIKMTTVVAMVALAESCKILGDAFSKFGSLSWDTISRGMAGMGAALGELVGAMYIFKKVGGLKSFAGATSLVIAVQALDEISDALKNIGQLNWEQIAKGLTGIGGALAELTIAIGLLGKLSGLSGIVGAEAIKIAVKGLDEISQTIAEIGELSWEEISRGLSGLGGALAELASITGLLGKLGGFSGLIGAGSLVIAVKSLADISKALMEIGQLSWEEIAKGLTGIGGAISELAVVSGSLGKLGGLSGLIGAETIKIVVKSLKDISTALMEIGQMSWDGIAKGLVGMGGALTELAVVTGLLGKLGGLAGLIGAETITIAVKGLGDLANSLKKFGEMNWDEISRGLTAMGAALGEVALGSLLNTLSFLGANSISMVSKSLGELADSVKKWAGVTVPDGLGEQLGKLAGGILKFTFDGFGANALAKAAPGLGVMADSVKKWAGVVVPENIGEQLKSLASGILKFTFDGFGASALAKAAPGLGIMANSVKKWQGVTVPENIGAQLKSLAKGVEAFTFAFLGGITIDTVVGPIGSLAGAIKKWQGVTIPKELGDDLKRLSGGIKSFTTAFFGGFSLDGIVKPLGELASSVSKWKNVTISNDLTTQLKSLAGAVKSFSTAFVGGLSLGSITGPLGDLAVSIKKFNGVAIPNGLAGSLKSIAGAIRSFQGISDISGTVSSVKSLTSSLSRMNGINYNAISSGLKSIGSSLSSLSKSAKSISGIGDTMVRNIVTPLNSIGGKVSSAGKNISNSLAKGMNSGAGQISATINNIVTKAVTAANSKANSFYTAGIKLGSKFIEGIKKDSSKAKSAVTSGLNSAVSAIKKYYGSFHSAGGYIASGLANGIRSKQSSVTAAAKSMAQQAYNAAKKTLKIKSPSRAFRELGYYIPEGLAVGINRLAHVASDAAIDMANDTYNGAKKAMSGISNTIDMDLDTQPTIRPVVDLSDIKSGANAINRMFGVNPSVKALATVGGINFSMNQNNQNNSTNEVVSAINKLGKILGNVGGTTNYINGITYDDGSNISEAVETLVHAAKIVRRS